MATKQIAWTTGNGNLTLTYQGQGDGTITVASDQNDLATTRSQTITIKTTKGGIKTKNLTITQSACPVPVNTVLSYSYTGSVQSVKLPAGRYKLQCWGAQGGSGGGYSGGKGGYSEGVLTLNNPTTVYIFVGGQGGQSGNGGWNGGNILSGQSSDRPTQAEVGTQFFDTSISPARPIYYAGNNTWVNATGTSV